MPPSSKPEPGNNEGPVPPPHIPHSRPAIGAAEVAAVSEVIASGMIAQGPRVEQLEKEVAELLQPGRVAGTAVSSGTAALYAALRALEIGEGDEVVMPAFVCAAVLQAVRTTGATPRFVDCDPRTFNMDPVDARRQVGKRTKAVIVAHLFGLPADIAELAALGPPVIEDCAQTLGASYHGSPVGSFGEIATCSFYATKLLAAGEGGMVLSSDGALLDRIRRMRDCERPDSSEWSFNLKMSDLHAAVGIAQLRRLSQHLERRRALAERYRVAFQDLPVRQPGHPDDREHQFFRFVVSLGDCGLEAVLDRCEELGVSCRRPVGHLPASVIARLDRLPGCREAWQTACSVPLYPALTDAEAELVVGRFKAALVESNDSATRSGPVPAGSGR